MTRRITAIARGAVTTIAAAALLGSGLVAAPAALAATVTAAELPALLDVVPEHTATAYDRNLFPHWIDADGDGCNTRFEVLIAQSTTEVTIGENCTISGGTWFSPYDGATHADPSAVDIDHLVALGEAWRSGAYAWSTQQRRDFANDLDVGYALRATTKSVNAQKSAWDPAWWFPPRDEYVCQYAIDWSLTKYRWNLSIDDEEQLALVSFLSGECGDRAVELPPVRTDIPRHVEVAAPVYETIIAPFPNGVTRLAGADRYSTAIEVSKRFSPNVPLVYLATGANFPDALSAASAAAVGGGPLLLNPHGSLLPAVRAELERLAPGEIVIVGGTSVVSPRVLDEVSALAPTSRLAGADRYATGLAIVRDAFPSASHAFIATGRTFPDALAASGAAGLLQSPVVLIDGTRPTVPAATLRLLLDLGVATVTVTGSTAAISAGIENQLRGEGFGVDRRGGADRYATAVAINTAYFSASATQAAFFATGSSFPDALAGAALAGQLGAPLFTSTQNCLPPVVYDSANALAPGSRVLLGGTSALGAGVAQNSKCVPPPPPPPKPKPVPPPPAVVSGPVTPGAFCKVADQGKIGYTTKGVKMTCVKYPGEKQPRWRAA